MEIRVSLALLALLAIIAAGLTASSPTATLIRGDVYAQQLRHLEDALAHDRANPALAQELAVAYLRLHRPGLAIVAIRSCDPALLADPLLSHRLAQAYEASGRLDDALATANLALARCGRAVGSSWSTNITRAPSFSCSDGVLVALEIHRQALLRMHDWGVTDPRYDSRATLAHQLSSRRARIASLDLMED